ncbi:MAG TPA: alpha-glucuronidase family glycosyl hydrolase [Opitutaceae bacterium]|nr:alpha-glucuronidase family glycosyl hydrolase [Opitutaceae bacterium]
MFRPIPAARLFLVACLAVAAARGEDGYELWLRYRPEGDATRAAEYRACTRSVVLAADDAVLHAAARELVRAAAGIARAAPPVTRVGGEGAVYLGDPGHLVPAAELAAAGAEGFVIRAADVGGRRGIVIAANSNRGVLYGTFRLIREMQLGHPVREISLADRPRITHRLANHWDNPVRAPGVRSESVERGYAGSSIFHWNELPQKIDPRLTDWARLLASLGLNGVVVNNVNTAKRGLEGWRLLTPEYQPKLVALAAVLRPYGVRLFISVNFFSPMLVGHLDSADPDRPEVKRWWRATADSIYAAIPDFGGFLVKADSEGEPGPMKYGRTQADGANVIADAVRPHGGFVYWRAFVYDRQAGDRVTQPYTTFVPLDGRFAANVFVQIKPGPLDFQVREPVSTLFGALPHTHEALELQITQEYTGQDQHVCFLAPQWSNVLEFDTHAHGRGSTVARLLENQLASESGGAIAGVMNLGSARNWTGHPLAQANTYAFGRLAWNPTEGSSAIARDWVELTYNRDPAVVATISGILRASWRAYEDYTAPLGLGLLSRRQDHFLPDPAGRQEDHHGDGRGVGFDRTVATGSGYVGQYHEPWRSRFEDPHACPEDLLLFFHHVPYTFRLVSGRTVIEEIYARHHHGVEEVRGFVRAWQRLRGRIDEERYRDVLARLQTQVKLAEQWRDSVDGYFAKLSGTPDSFKP